MFCFKIFGHVKVVILFGGSLFSGKKYFLKLKFETQNH